jgi:hypothetical protein
MDDESRIDEMLDMKDIAPGSPGSLKPVKKRCRSDSTPPTRNMISGS